MSIFLANVLHDNKVYNLFDKKRIYIEQQQRRFLMTIRTFFAIKTVLSVQH